MCGRHGAGRLAPQPEQGRRDHLTGSDSGFPPAVSKEIPMSAQTSPIPENTLQEIDKANASGRTPVVFIHGLWLLPSSWDRWAAVFEEAGYAPLTPPWPDDPETVEESNAHPEGVARKTVGQVADHYSATIGRADNKPAVPRH